MVLEGCKTHLNQVHLRTVLTLWKKETSKQGDFRRFQLKIYSKMDQYRLK